MTVSEETKKYNRELCERYPFLIPRNRFSGKRITDAKDGGFWPGDPDAVPEYDYEYTELDEMPDGWRKAFGEKMCEEIREELLRAGGEKLLNEYMIVQIKEKYGQLRWYDSGFTEEGSKIISKYARLSECTCIRCGKPATLISTGWISPWCDECAGNVWDRMVPIDEWFEPDVTTTADQQLVEEMLAVEEAAEDLIGVPSPGDDSV